MSLPTIDTFEHDISEEIKTKEATIGDIASAGGEIGNTTPQRASQSVFVILLGIILIVAIVAVSIILVVKYYGPQPATTPSLQTTQASTAAGLRVDTVSPTIAGAIGSSLGTVQKSEYGYTISLSSYSDAFSYMLKNESAYADELARAVGSPRDTSTTTPPFTFGDTTINNQNMRVGTAGSSTVVYAFVNTNYLLISASTDGILKLRSAILH